MFEIIKSKLNNLMFILTTNTLSIKEHETICIQINLLDSLLDEFCSSQQESYNYGYDEAEFEDNNPYYYFSDIDKYMLERRDLIEEQIETAHNTLHFTKGIGKSVINLDSHWFTSDEIEAFRVIWQRRISAI